MKSLRKLSFISTTFTLSCVLPVLLLTTSVHATNGLAGVSQSVNTLKGIIGVIGGVLMTLLFIAFFWSIISFIRNQGTEKEAAKTRLVWSSVAMFVALSIWGIVAWLGSVTGVNTNQNASSGTNIIPGVR